jgi:hypothetical protein
MREACLPGQASRLSSILAVRRKLAQDSVPDILSKGYVYFFTHRRVDAVEFGFVDG